MLKKIIFAFILSFLISGFASAQKPEKQQPAIDTSYTDYDALFSEMDAFLDSILAPRNFTLINLGATTAYFNYVSKESNLLTTNKKFLYTPSISYFLKSGLGVSAAANIVNDGQQINPYQYSLT